MKSSSVTKKTKKEAVRRPIQISGCTFTGSPSKEVVAALHVLAEAAKVNAEALVLAARQLAGPQTPMIDIRNCEITP